MNPLTHPSSLETPLPAARRSFTLIEMLAVIAVITVLICMSMPMINYVNRKSSDAAIKTQIKAIENALEAYKADYGGYPPLEPDDLYTTNLLFYMWTGKPRFHASPWDPPGWAEPGWTNGWLNTQYLVRALTQGPKKYISFPPKQIVTNLYVMTPGVSNYFFYLADPNGQAYGYISKGAVANPGGFDLWSIASGTNEYPRILDQNRTPNIGNWMK
jgi:prepilin-type N-terminal cleavage/methylation domain-containing protein